MAVDHKFINKLEKFRFIALSETETKSVPMRLSRFTNKFKKSEWHLFSSCSLKMYKFLRY